MKLIVGLGNPGLRYAGTRHNIGFRIIKALGKLYKVGFKKDRNSRSLTAEAKDKEQGFILAMPLNYMNLSGGAVKELAARYKAGNQDILVVCDDIDLEFGRIKIKPSGSSGGHRGLKSIIDSLATQGFARLRVGVGRPGGGIEPAEHVLLDFSRAERKELPLVIERAAECCRAWLGQGIDKSMNNFNKNGKEEQQQ